MNDRPNNYHLPVMVSEVLDYLDVRNNSGGVYVDATASTGGHSQAIAENMSESGTLIGLDLDENALLAAKERLDSLPPQVTLYHLNYRRIEELLNQEGYPKADGVLFDLGMSSVQVDDAARGFSFRSEGPLDMRMDTSSQTTAKDLVNTLSREELEDIIRKYGEERWAKAITEAIIERRKEEEIATTDELATIVEKAIPEKHRYKRSTHPATQTFQALRIAVNDELENLEDGLSAAFNCLKVGGRLVVISYHSLEDRIVKKFLRYKEKSCVCPPKSPVCRCDKVQEAKQLTEGPVRPSEEEVRENPRARSALLRAARVVQRA